ncbi:MAG: hypothetical protein JNM39_00855 [Bdellovibrionaceae bacterium]|nr:hypothetical protein [Pseudobdellovibrionaceae bacterium]
MSVFFFSLLISFANATEAKDCSDRDLRSRFGKVRDQGPSWCYAYTVADLFSEANGLSLSNPVSPLDVGVTYISAQQREVNEAVSLIHVEDEYARDYSKRPPASIYNGIYPDKRRNGNFGMAAALYLRKNRLCTEEQAPTMDEFSSSKPIDFENKLAGTGAIAQEGEMTFLQRVINIRIEQFREAAPVVAQCRSLSQTLNQTLLQADLAKALNNFAMEKLKNSLELSCKNSRLSREIQIHTKGNSEKSFRGDAKKLLDRHRPFEIGYDFCGLAKREVSTGCVHSSIVVGRKYEDGVCQMLVRNSHGENCTQFEGLNVKCAEDSPGYFWVNEDLLDKTVSEYHWIENEKEFFSERIPKKTGHGY